MDNKKSKSLGGGGVHQLNNRCNYLPFDLQLFADTLNYNKVDNPYNFYLNKPTYTKGEILKKIYNLVRYYKNIPNYDTITTLPEENADYIKEALPNVTSCHCMMGDYYSGGGCKVLTSIDTTGWDTSNITDMSDMFAICNKLQTIDVSKFNTSKVTDISVMFSSCKALKTLDVSKWDTSNVTSMNCMFQSCITLTTLDASNWDTSKVTDMSGMFDGCWSLKTIKGIIDMKSCDSCDDMFRGCYLTSPVKIKNPPPGITATSGIGGLDAGQYEIVS